ncbi:MAG: hypothetical protein EOM40_05280 [Clostridia bacterium]|nr:hypothetical protein [Clostridia bacterium]NCC44105.1 hypothetical protein [Clostridia bacterium]
MQERILIDTEKLKDELIQVLERKYDEKFYPLFLEVRNYSEGEDILRFYSDIMNPQKEYSVIRRSGKESKYTYRDNYFAQLVLDEYEQRVQKAAGGVFGEVKVFVHSIENPFFDDHLTKESSLDEAVKLQGKIWSNTFVFTPAPLNGINKEIVDGSQREFERKCEQLGTQLYRQGLKMTLKAYEVVQELYDTIDFMRYEDRLKEYQKKDKENWKCEFRKTFSV